MTDRALIIGHTGQDGRYLSEFLVHKGYAVAGVSRGGAWVSEGEGIPAADIMRREEVSALIRGFSPDEIYYLAAHHHSSEDAREDDHDLLSASFEVHVQGFLNVLDAAADAPSARVFYAASSHVFGDPVESPQNEDTPKQPNCAYGISKLAGMNIARYYREARGLQCSCGILYNHESPYRGAQFLSAKIVRAAAAIHRGEARTLCIGDLDAETDWGFAGDYVRAAWYTLQLDHGDDFIISSGHLHTVREFVEHVFAAVELDWRDHVRVDPSIITKQPTTKPRFGDYSKLAGLTGWRPTMNLNMLARHMVEHELKKD